MKTQPNRPARGFTLIEIMFALFLLGMVVLAIYSSWSAVMRGSKSGLEAAAAVQRSRMAMRTLENALTCARSFAADIENYYFVAENGNDASLSFVASLPDSFPRGGKFGDYHLRRVTFSLEQGPDLSRRFVLRQNLVLMDPDKDEQEHPVVLAGNVKEFYMEFWDKKEQDWVEEWTQTNQLPQMVRVSLQFTGKEPNSPVKEEVTRIISLPSSMVQAAWQMPGFNPGLQQRNPGAQRGPGTTP